LVSSLHIDTILDDKYRNAELKLKLAIDRAGQSTRGIRVRLTLLDPAGKEITIAPSEFQLEQLISESSEVTLKAKVDNPLKWNAEKPHLYRLKMELLQNEKVLETIKRNVGFRRLEVKGGKLLVNGQPVILAGINRHEIDSLTGRADTVKHARIDAKLFKEANINYIRTSHYPPTKEFLDACDQTGIYVEVEAPFCWTRNHKAWENNPNYLRYFMEPTAAMLEYHRNHPSVIIWSLSNESGRTPNEQETDIPANYWGTLNYCHKSDPSRPVCFNNEWAKDGGKCDIAILHYQNPPFTNAPHLKQDNRPIILDEYWHIPTYQPTELSIDPGRRIQWGLYGNASNSTWNTLMKTKNVIGAAIWAGIDEVFLLPDGKTTGYGPWGIIDVWRRKKPEWWLTKIAYSPVCIKIRQVDYRPGQSEVVIPVENRYSFTNLGQLKTTWQIGAHTGQLSLDIPALSQGEIKISLERLKDVEAGQFLELRFYNDDEKIISANRIQLGENKLVNIPQPVAGCPEVTEENNFLHIEGNNYKLVLDKKTGQFVDKTTNVPLLGFPTIHATRKELGFSGTISRPYTEYPDMSSGVIKSVIIDKREKALSVTLHNRYTDFEGSVEWLIDKEGKGIVSYDYIYRGEKVPAREAGIRFVLDRQCQTIKWHCSNSETIYPKGHIGRLKGTAKAIYEGSVDYLSSAIAPQWPWSLDMSERGTNDFRCTKFHVYNASIFNSENTGLAVISDGNVHVRASLVPEGVQFHILDVSPVSLDEGTRLRGNFNVQIGTKLDN